MLPRSRLGKTNFCLTKKPSNSIQKLFMTETVSTVIEAIMALREVTYMRNF